MKIPTDYSEKGARELPIKPKLKLKPSKATQDTTPVSNLTGSMRVMKGEIDVSESDRDDGSVVVKKAKVFSWDAVDLCEKNECLAWKRCPYKKTINANPVYEHLCYVEYNYLRAVEYVLFTDLAPRFSQDSLMQAGLQLVPLYRMLCKFQIAEMSVGIKDVIIQGKVMPLAHPIYREIRQTIKSIGDCWGSLGIRGTKAMELVDDLANGRQDYYELVEKGQITPNKLRSAREKNGREKW